ncbi:MAG: S8 family serine peptidase [Bacteroidales bacterium]|nr:S8 family serine peptidase [Bacteroidales bacterium]
MFRTSTAVLGLSALLLAGCTADQALPPQALSVESTPDPNDLSTRLQLAGNSYQAGTMHVKFSKATAQRFALDKGRNRVQMHSVPSRLTQALQSIGTSELEPLFPLDPRWEKRMREAGLDQWYILRFDEKKPMAEALSSLQTTAGVEALEPAYTITTFDVKVKEAQSNKQLHATGAAFNDPDLADQWHYSNDGKRLDKSMTGADINLFEAWAHETGKSNVIVSVVDGGVDATHEDLAENMWTNKGEVAGDGIDNDHNGYIDDIHGWNFNAGTKEIVPDNIGHGTHVAGTVAARNNNGKGGCGVAGGDGTPGSGVRIMSCQTFAGQRNSVVPTDKNEESDALNASSDGAVRAIVYGANNGAVISQNSWGYRFPGIPEIPADVKAAIDYFRKWAGCDNEGKQLPNSPMKGGVVIFAAGNDDADYLCYPAAYEPTISVAAMGPNWMRASYSNRGAWVDLMAPGGDQGFSSAQRGGMAGQVYSTLPYNRYGFMAGTSMACPHVSGIAALAVSKFGKQGFTAAQLEHLLLTSFRPQHIYARNTNPREQGRLGKGYIDAGLMFAIDHKKAPQTVEALATTPAWTSTHVAWKAVSDEDDKHAVSYRLYKSTSPLTDTQLPSMAYDSLNSLGVNPGEDLEFVLRNMHDDTDYYIGVAGVDRWGNMGKLKVEKVHTKLNHAPQFDFSVAQPYRVSVRQRVKLRIPLNDADGHQIKVALSGEARGVSHTFKDNVLNISLAAIAPYGKYAITIKATDQFDKESTLNIPFEVYQYIEPAFIATNEQGQTAGLPVVGVKDQAQTFDLRSLLTASEGAQLQYTVSSVDEQVLKVAVDAQGILTLRGIRPGKTKVRVTVADGISQPITKTFEVRVAEHIDNLVYSVYPIPATRDLNLVLNGQVNTADIEIISMTGRSVLTQTAQVVNGKIKLDVRPLTPGSYTLKVRGKGKSSTHRFVKL